MDMGRLWSNMNQYMVFVIICANMNIAYVSSAAQLFHRRDPGACALLQQTSQLKATSKVQCYANCSSECAAVSYDPATQDCFNFNCKFYESELHPNAECATVDAHFCADKSSFGPIDLSSASVMYSTLEDPNADKIGLVIDNDASTCLDTKPEPSAWFAFDLGAHYIITSVGMTNSPKDAQHRQQMTVSVTTDRPTNGLFEQTLQDSATCFIKEACKFDDPFLFGCDPCPVYGRYLYVSSLQRPYTPCYEAQVKSLHICELQVNGCPA